MFYDFECSFCQTIKEFDFPIGKCPNTVRCACGKGMQRVYLTAPNFIGYARFGYDPLRMDAEADVREWEKNHNKGRNE